MIYIPETIKSAFRSLLLNKVRTALTMLGVIIGVFSVVSLVSVVQGFQNYITDQFNALGSNLILVTPSFGGANQDPSRAFMGNKLSTKNVDTIQLFVGDKIEAITPSIRVVKQVKYKTKTYTATLVGGNYASYKVYDLETAYGDYYKKADDTKSAKVVFISWGVKKDLFGDKNPVGEKVKIENITFDVVGVAKPKGGTFDERVFIPATTAIELLDLETVSSIAVKVKEEYDLDEVMHEIKVALLRDMKADDFSVTTQKDILASIDQILSVLSVALAAVAGISLLVGGIGIMNIMLVSVTERTQEIGLRKALGATSKNIGMQFLTESIIISLTGGILGLLFGYLGTIAISSFLRATIPWWAVIIALGFSVIVGVVFGTYPALSASKKDPIEALRFE
ncbi:MAG: multidrug ABC transporter substrate-binding protein [Patescibacteria group bacterium]|nr:MAG: multidrug ABC transporter substrate-binding protein [Patescibacteria group bacterium]